VELRGRETQGDRRKGQAGLKSRLDFQHIGKAFRQGRHYRRPVPGRTIGIEAFGIRMMRSFAKFGEKFQGSFTGWRQRHPAHLALVKTPEQGFIENGLSVQPEAQGPRTGQFNNQGALAGTSQRGAMKAGSGRNRQAAVSRYGLDLSQGGITTNSGAAAPGSYHHKGLLVFICRKYTTKNDKDEDELCRMTR